MGEAIPERPDGVRDRWAEPGRAEPDRTLADRAEGAGNGQPEQTYFRGVAAVPRRSVAPSDETGEVLAPDQALPPPAPPAGNGAGRWSKGYDRWRSGQVGAAAPPGGRWRTLRRGIGWSVTGFWFVVVSWAVWAISQRPDLLGAVLAIGVVLAIGALVFTVSRLLGRVVLEGTLGRQRNSAWPSHLVTFVLLVVGGVAFLQRTWWLVDAWHWLADQLV